VTRPRRGLRRLLARVHVCAACRCPACDKTEQHARAQLGMPRLHPERITRTPRHREETWLRAAEAVLWPDDEYAAIILEFRREDRP
jgi:hypothetical protein